MGSGGGEERCNLSFIKIGVENHRFSTPIFITHLVSCNRMVAKIPVTIMKARTMKIKLKGKKSKDMLPAKTPTKVATGLAKRNIFIILGSSPLTCLKK